MCLKRKKKKKQEIFCNITNIMEHPMLKTRLCSKNINEATMTILMETSTFHMLVRLECF
jgi:hypothetical protein